MNHIINAETNPLGKVDHDIVSVFQNGWKYSQIKADFLNPVFRQGKTKNKDNKTRDRSNSPDDQQSIYPPDPDNDVQSEYEKNFRALGQPIHRIECLK